MRAPHAGLSNQEPKLKTEIARDPELLLSSPNPPLHPLFYFLGWVKCKKEANRALIRTEYRTKGRSCRQT